MILFLVYDGIAEECVFSASMICDYLIRLAETFTGCQTRYDKLMDARGKIIGLEDVETAAVLGWQAETVKKLVEEDVAKPHRVLHKPATKWRGI